jgi:hypothetical protein
MAKAEITDLFSHKIHSSAGVWPERVAELAFLFRDFAGKIFDRNALEERLKAISPRASFAARALSEFRDEISAYPAYLGLYRLRTSAAGWVLELTDTAKRLLIREEPDVGAFLRLQLALFQYPNAMGAAYYKGTNRLRIQANARDRTLQFIKRGVHLCPLRLIISAIQADAELRGISIFDAEVTFQEVYSLANDPAVNKKALPKINSVKVSLQSARDGKGFAPPNFERRFHILKHLEMFNVQRGRLSLRKSESKADRVELQRKFNALLQISNQFNDFDSCKSGQDIENVIASGKWAAYFDGIKSLKGEVVEALTSEEAMVFAAQPQVADIPLVAAVIFPLKDRREFPLPPKAYDRKAELADPELTRIKRQRRNLAHKELIDKMDQLLRKKGVVPKENPHIDLFAQIPEDGCFIFEMKSGGENLLDQIRKGISQLYEYRFRYRETIGEELSLCLVIPARPSQIPWIEEYLCADRQITVCWFDEGDNLVYPGFCGNSLGILGAVPA